MTMDSQLREVDVQGSPVPEDPNYVTPALYERIVSQHRRAIGRDDPAPQVDLEVVSRFLLWEARLLDFRLYRKWMTLMAEDCIYWLPAGLEAADPRDACGVNFDDRRRLFDRIALMETGAHHAQTPPSTICRMVSNIETWPADDGVLVRSNLALWEHRKLRTNCFVGWQEHELVREGDGFRIRLKIINLINGDEPLGNVSFIV